MKHCVYIVGSRTGTLYIGMTNNIYRRMWKHKSGEFEGFASKYRCNRKEDCADRERQLAMARSSREMGGQKWFCRESQ